MRQFWIVPGSEANWQQALTAKGIWGLEDQPLDRIYWLALAPDDILLFYVSGKVKGIVGYGVVRSKFRQDVPLWDDEIKEGRVKWPLRFEFDGEFLLPQSRWSLDKVPLSRGGQFRQPLILKNPDELSAIIKQLNPTAEIVSLKDATVFAAPPEVQVSGDLYHAVGKLKHAHDIWNSRIFLVGSMDDAPAVNKLLSGTFHEIKSALRFIEIARIQQLHQSKWHIFDVEKELGLLP